MENAWWQQLWVTPHSSYLPRLDGDAGLHKVAARLAKLVDA